MPILLNSKKLLLTLFFLVTVIFPAFSKDLIVNYIDIGQGDSELIELPDGKNILIDAGDKDGADKLIKYLKSKNISKLDLVIITHPHLDHYGGLIKTIKTVDIVQVFESGVKTSSSTYTKLLKAFLDKKVKFKMPRKGDELKYDNGITLKILAPQEPLLKNTKSDANNSSIVAKLTYNKISFLFTGDIEEDSQNQILANKSDIKSNILKVAHHGSRYTSSDEFLDTVKPDLAIISCGQGNSYKHPHQETLDRLKNRNIPIYRTDLNGNIVVSTDGTTYKIKTDNQTDKIKNQVTKINLNTAESEYLELLPSINAEKSKQIISLRPITSWESLSVLNLTEQEMIQIKEQAFFNEKKEQKITSNSTHSKKNKKNTALLDKININTASIETLKTLPGIGEKTAEKIIKGRPYTSTQDLEKVDGLGKKKVEKLLNFIIVD